MCSEGMYYMKDIMLNYRKVRRIKQWNCPTISIPRIIIFLFMFDVLFVSAKYASWTNEDADFGTVHEQLGQPHFPYAEFTPYRSKAKYNTEPKYNSFGIRPTHLFTHTLFGKASSVPKDYITFVNGTNALAFGQKSAENSWASLLCCNKLMLVWTIFMLFLIIAIPFVAVTYFCFCFYRCPTVCECNEYVDRRMRHLWSILLLLLIVGLIVGLIVVMLNDKLIDQGVQQNWANIQKITKIFAPLSRIRRIMSITFFVNNFEELETHLNAQLMDVSNHIFMDLSDASGLYALTELEEILLNMPRALTLMERVDKDIDTLTFYIAQYRDGLRFIRRKLTYFLTVWCDYKRCNDILRTSGILKWDTSVCLHLDLLPNIPIFIESLHDIIRANLLYIPKQGLYNYQVVGEMIRENLHDQLPQFSIKLAELSEIYSKQGADLQDLIRSRMSTTYNQHANMTKVFHELEQSYGRDRKVISIALSVSILTITILLISALICGWCVRRNNSGSKCLLVAILLISVILSLLLLVCLFYSIMGLIIYHAVCIPRTAEERYNVFNTDVEQIFNVNESICRKDQNIFDLLRDAGLYDINILRNENTNNNITPEYVSEFTGDLSSIVILTEQHKIMLNDMRNGNLSDYHGQWIRKQLCHKLSQVDLMQCKMNLQEFGKSLHGDRRSLAYQYRINGTLNNMCRLSFDMNQIVSLQRPIDDLINRIRADVTTIDRLITRNDSDFNNTILPLIEAITKAESFLHTRGAEYINALTLKFVEYLEDAINKYVEHVIQECTFTIGRCGPLAQMHNRSINNLCHNLADPINGYWLGLLICGLLFFPILLVAHKLLCLYRLYAAIIYLNDNQFDCPACSGTPFVQAPYIISTGNKIHFCGCEEPYKEKDA